MVKKSRKQEIKNMFDHINQKSTEQDQEQSKNINLLPDNLKSKQKPKQPSSPRPDFKISKQDWHLPSPSSTPPRLSRSDKVQFQPKLKSQKLFNLKTLLSKFKRFRSKPESVVTVKKAPEPKITQPKPPTEDSHSSIKKQPPSPSLKSETKPHQSQPIKYSQVKDGSVHRHEQREEELEVNLLPAQKQVISPNQAFLIYTVATVVTLALVLIPYFVFNAKNKDYQYRNESLSADIVVVDTNIEQALGEIAVFGPLSDRLKYINELLDQHIYWSKFFPSLESYTVPTVYFTDLSAGSDGTINLAAQGFNLRAVAEQLVVLNESDIYTDVNLTNLRLPNLKEATDDSQIEFSLIFQADPRLVNIAIEESSAK